MNFNVKDFLEPVIIPSVQPNPRTLREESLTIEHQIFYETVCKGNIPIELPEINSEFDFPSNFTYHHFLMKRLHEIGFFTVATQKFAKSFKKYLPKNSVVLDPLAGKGYLGKALREQNVPTILTDNDSKNISSNTPEIEKLDAITALKKYGDYITHVVIAWADYESVIDYKILSYVREFLPHVTVINIGEEPTGGFPGCTGSMLFWDTAEKIVPLEVEYQSLMGLHDFVAEVK